MTQRVQECRTKDCIRGGGGIPGCELHCSCHGRRATWIAPSAWTVSTPVLMTTSAFLPDRPGKELWHDSFSLGYRPIWQSTDLAALIVVLVFVAFVNAAGMVAPVLEWRDQVTVLIGQRSPMLVTSLFYIVGLPYPTDDHCRYFGDAESAGSANSACRRSRWPPAFPMCFLPLGFGMWLAHYSFHFLASFDAVIPALSAVCQ